MPWISPVVLVTIAFGLLCFALVIARQRRSHKLRPAAPVRLAALLGSGASRANERWTHVRNARTAELPPRR